MTALESVCRDVQSSAIHAHLPAPSILAEVRQNAVNAALTGAFRRCAPEIGQQVELRQLMALADCSDRDVMTWASECGVTNHAFRDQRWFVHQVDHATDQSEQHCQITTPTQLSPVRDVIAAWLEAHGFHERRVLPP